MTTTEKPLWGVSEVDHDPVTPSAPAPGLGRRVIGGAAISAAAIVGGVLLLTSGDAQSPPAGSSDGQAAEATDAEQVSVTEAVVSPTVQTTAPPTTTLSTAVPSTAVPSTAAPTTAAPTTAAPTTAAPTTAAPLTTSAATEVALAIDQRGAVFRNGIMYLSGAVPSQTVSDELTRRVGAIIGSENVVTDHTIDPSVEVSDTSFLYIDDLVLFEPGQSEITEPFEALLDLAIVLMNVNPAVEVTVEAHTDSIGPAGENLTLSQVRADAVKDYWVAAGIDPARVTAVGLGESEPYADNTTSEGRRLNRRAEFTILNFLG